MELLDGISLNRIQDKIEIRLDYIQDVQATHDIEGQIVSRVVTVSNDMLRKFIRRVVNTVDKSDSLEVLEQLTVEDRGRVADKLTKILSAPTVPTWKVFGRCKECTD